MSRRTRLAAVVIATAVGLVAVVALAILPRALRAGPTWQVECLIGDSGRPVDLDLAGGRDAVVARVRAIIAPAAASTKRPVLATVVTVRIERLSFAMPLPAYALVAPDGSSSFAVIQTPTSGAPTAETRPVAEAATAAEALQRLAEHLADRILAEPPPR